MRFLIVVVLLFVSFVVYRKEVLGISYSKPGETIGMTGGGLETDGWRTTNEDETKDVLCGTLSEDEKEVLDESRSVSVQNNWCNR